MSRTAALGMAMSLPLFLTPRFAGAQLDDWNEMNEELASVEAILGGDVSNGYNPVGSVSDLVLSEDGSRVQYILFEVPYPYSLYGGEDGFVTFDAMDLQRGVGLDLEVVYEDEESVSAPEELTLSASEAANRLASRIIGEQLFFSADNSREVKDILIDRETGEVMHWIVEMDPDTLFSAERRAIPADQITVEDGSARTSIELASVDDVQEYDTTLL